MITTKKIGKAVVLTRDELEVLADYHMEQRRSCGYKRASAAREQVIQYLKLLRDMDEEDHAERETGYDGMKGKRCDDRT